MESKLISIIVPIYNTPMEYLLECLKSLVNQTIKDKIEIILVNDGSKDELAKICDEYAIMYNYIKVIHQKNQGLSMARNAGIKIASGKWILLVDSDDWVEKDICEKLIQNDNDDIDIIITSCNDCYKNKRVNRATFNEDYIKFNNDEKETLQLQVIANEVLGKKVKNAAHIGAPWARLYRASFIKKNKLWFEKDLHRREDAIFNLYSFELARNIVYKKEFLYNYRRCEESLSNIHDRSIITFYLEYIEEELKFIKKYNKNSIFYEAHDIRILKFISDVLNKYVFKANILNYKERKEILENILEREDVKKALYRINTKNLSLYQKFLLIALRKRKLKFIKLIVYIRYTIKSVIGQVDNNMY